MNDKLFDIVTLSDRATNKNFPKLKTHYLRHGNELIKRKRRLGDNMDPLSWLIAGGGISSISNIIAQLFPGWLGNNQLATEQDFIDLLPGNGTWTTTFRQYLKSNIKYKKDIQRDLYLYTHNFVKMNHQQLYPETNIDNWGIGRQKLYDIMRKEAMGQGSQVYPTVSAGFEGWLPWIIVGGLALALIPRKRK